MLSLKKTAGLALLFIFAGTVLSAEPTLPSMKFKEVKEVANILNQLHYHIKFDVLVQKQNFY